MNDMIAMFRRSPGTAERIREILRLPDDMFTEVRVEINSDAAATATVSLILSGEQLVALATLAAEAFTKEAQ